MSAVREDAIAIWQAGVAAVDSAALVENAVQVDDDAITICGHRWERSGQGRICVVGAGKAGAGMAAGLETALGADWLPHVSGWVNVPEDCVRPLQKIHLHGARPAGMNEPTEAGVFGTQQILDRVRSLTADDLCIVLISGGGSALLPAPVDGITLQDKQQVTRVMMHSGATIQELNTVRRALSRVKGGGLLRASRAGQLITLIISDVIGDPLETIASGPTVPTATDPHEVVDILTEVAKSSREAIPLSVLEVLSQQIKNEPRRSDSESPYFNEIIGNNRTAVTAAAKFARLKGYEIVHEEFDIPGDVNEFARAFADHCLQVRNSSPKNRRLCLISGGEPTVQLAQTESLQKGGRNQQFVLAAAEFLSAHDFEGITILAGGTDGEDGPTDAAGAVIDQELLENADRQGVSIAEHLNVNNSYPFFERIGGLLVTGPTHTNVMDLRIGIVVT